MIRVELSHDFFGGFLCPNDVIGWENFEHSLVRSEKWKGVHEAFGLSLKFFGPALKFVTNCYERDGPDVSISLTVTEIDHLGGTLVFNGLLNFAEGAEWARLADHHQPPPAYQSRFVTAEVVPAPNDLKTKLESRSKVKVTMPVAVADVYNADPEFLAWREENAAPLDLDGASLTDLRLFRPDKVFVPGRPTSRTDVYRPEQLPYSAAQSNSSSGDNWFQQQLKIKDGTIETAQGHEENQGPNEGDLQPVFVAARDGLYRFRYAINGVVRWKNNGLTLGSALTFRIGWGSDANEAFVNCFTTSINTGLGTSAENQLSFNADRYVFLLATQGVWAYQRQTSASVLNNVDIEIRASEYRFEVGVVEFAPARLADAFLLHEFTAGLLNIITGREVLQSTVMGRTDSYPTPYEREGNAGGVAVLSGNWLRQRTKGIPTSFDELWESIDGCYNLGLWVNEADEKIVIENARFFFQDQLAATFDFVDNIKVSVATDWLFNEAKFRFNKLENRGANWPKDPHGSVSFTAPVKFFSNSYEKNSPYLASGEAMSLAKAPRDGEEDATGYENDRFLLVVGAAGRIRIPVLTARNEGVGSTIFLAPNDVWDFYFERFSGERPYFAPSLPDVFPTELRIFNAGSNDGNYTVLVPLSGAAFSSAWALAEALPNPSQIRPGESYVEIANRETAIKYAAKTDQDYGDFLNYDLPQFILNADLTPKRCLLRHKIFWNQGVLKTPSRIWQFGEGEGNTEFGSQRVSAPFDSDEFLTEVLKQNQAIEPFDQLLPAKTVPEYIEFRAPMSIEKWNELKSKRHGIVRVSDRDGNHLEGFIIEAKRVRKREEVIVNFKLIRSFGPAENPVQPPPPDPPPAPQFGLAFVANTFVLGANVLSGIFGISTQDDLTSRFPAGAQVVISWFNNSAVTTQNMVVAAPIAGVPNIVVFTTEFAAMPGATQFNSLNMKVRLVSTGEILKFGPLADQLVPDP